MWQVNINYNYTALFTLLIISQVYSLVEFHELLSIKNMKNKIHHLLNRSNDQVPTQEISTDLERRAHFLRILNRGWLVMGSVAVISYFFYPQDRTQLFFFIIIAFSTYFLVRFLNSRKWIIQAGFIFTLLVNFSFFGAFLVSFLELGLTQALLEYKYILMMMGLAIIFAGAFIHRYAAFSLAALNSTLMLVLLTLEPQAGPELSVHIFWWLVAIISWLYERTLELTFSRLTQERENLENKVEYRTHELRETVQELEQTQRDLQAKNDELESFSYSVSHDLRAPLRALNGYSNALEEDYHDQLPEEGRNILHRIRENVKRMDLLIQDLLILSRLDRTQLTRQTIHPSQMVRQVMEELRKDNPDQNVDLELEELHPCEADPILLRQVFFNLLSNALKFSRQRDPIRLAVASRFSPEGVVYSVRDNGVGFDNDLSGRLFTPFQRMHRTDEYEGTGIGLSIVRRIIQRHGGRVWVEAAVDQGATFYFTLGE